MNDVSSYVGDARDGWNSHSSTFHNDQLKPISGVETARARAQSN